ncbi:hypothetical protein [Candidatus Protochlamydia sp. W-9]|uniref:hypothetical protein n=1 Tax=Candidatus Protochlamydia sp. W-9 TaxID=1785087 RepID=UPI00096A4107|nr:hypothetical protein [Candidatus Protochlamydia sp. W-9]
MGKITFAYDLYGRKFLPALSPQYDIQSRTFEKIKNGMDGLYFITFFLHEFHIDLTKVCNKIPFFQYSLFIRYVKALV